MVTRIAAILVCDYGGLTRKPGYRRQPTRPVLARVISRFCMNTE